ARAIAPAQPQPAIGEELEKTFAVDSIYRLRLVECRFFSAVDSWLRVKYISAQMSHWLAAALKLKEIIRPFKLFARELTIYHSPDREWVGVLQFIRKCTVGKVLIAQRASKSIDRLRADRSCARVRAGRIWPPMNHRMAYLDTRRITVEHDSPHLIPQNLDQLGILTKIFFSPMHSCCQMTAQAPRCLQHLLSA